jgi:hypothetical protein
LDDLVGLLVWAAMLGIYLIPTLVAYSQQHHHVYAIAFLNVLSGWTLLGWIGALVWAFRAEESYPQKKNHHRKQKPQRKSTARLQQDDPVTRSDLMRRLAELKPHPMHGGEPCLYTGTVPAHI